MESFYEQFTRLRADILEIRERLGNPRLRQLAFQSGTEFIFIRPIPKFSIPDPTSSYPTNEDERLNGIVWECDVPRFYEEDLINNKSCWLDARLINNQITGIICRSQIISNTSGLKWNLRIYEEYFNRDEDILDGLVGL